MSNDRAAQSRFSKSKLASAKRWVCKFGSALVADDDSGLCQERIEAWCADIATARRNGCEVLVVTSGAVAGGMQRLGLSERPKALEKLQATAAVGQTAVMDAYESAFRKQNVTAAMVLLTHRDITERQSYLNARNTLRTLMKMNVVPVINENDTVATEEMRLGDNDLLAALVANLIEADALALVTDQKGLHKANPRTNPDAPLIEIADASDTSLDVFAGPSGELGRGGMKTKLQAARQAARSGTLTIICDGRAPGTLSKLFAGQAGGTTLLPDHTKTAAKKLWLLSRSDCRGGLVLDQGAVDKLRHGGSSLLPIGVSSVSGHFEKGDLISCCDAEGVEIARGLVNYSITEARLIVGRRSEEILERLGYGGAPELVHRDNLALIQAGEG